MLQPALPDLLHGDRPSVDPTVEPARTCLDPTSWVDVAPGWLRGADGLYVELAASLPWRRHRRAMYGELVDEPRLSCRLALDDPALPPVLGEMSARLSARYGEALDQGWANWYRDGDDAVAWHADRIGRSRRRPLVAVVSLGGPRRFRLRPKGGGPARTLVLHTGDLVVMGGDTQHRWEHSVPRQRGAAGRISVMFRPPAMGGA